MSEDGPQTSVSTGVHVRPRYVSVEETFHIAPLPTRVIDKGIPRPGLLATIIYDKFVSHLPFYRQVQRYEQLGMKISASTGPADVGAVKLPKEVFTGIASEVVVRILSKVAALGG